jgi:hypothetical protein
MSVSSSSSQATEKSTSFRNDVNVSPLSVSRRSSVRECRPISEATPDNVGLPEWRARLTAWRVRVGKSGDVVKTVRFELMMQHPEGPGKK